MELDTSLLRFMFGVAISISIPAHAHQVISIADGDTLTLLVDRSPVKIRLANIDAPELKQAFGQRSKQSLSNLCWGKDTHFKKQSIDRYGRIVATVICDDIDANVKQVERGMAWIYTKYNSDPHLPAVQDQAKDDGVGLWQDTNPIPPWKFRQINNKNKN